MSVALLKLDNDNILSLSKRNLISTWGRLNSSAAATSLALFLSLDQVMKNLRGCIIMHLGLISIMDILDPYCKQDGVVTVVGNQNKCSHQH